jgi:hypothetical protein
MRASPLVALVLAAACRSAEPPAPDERAPGEVPSSDGWERVSLGKAKVAFRIPDGAAVDEDRAGHDESFAGTRFRVTMPSGYDVLFAERHPSGEGDVIAEKRRYEATREERVRTLFAADDAIVVHRSGDEAEGGAHCEVTACSSDAQNPICAVQQGARIEGTHARRLTEAECFAVVAVARSIERR